MSHKYMISFAALCGLAFGQETPRMTAREIFYGAPAAAVQKRPETSKKSPAPSAGKKKASEAVGGEMAKNSPAEVKPPARTEPVTPVHLAADTAGSANGLAMRWSIMQKLPNGSSKEVPTTTAFKEGDKINVRVEVNDFGYLYILARGSSGNWTPLFPSPKIAGGDNRVGPNQPYMIPSGYVFSFDDKPGAERLMVVFSRKPENDFDSLLYKVAPDRDNSKPTAPMVTPATPGAAPAKPTQAHPGIIMASNTTIGDPFIDRIRTTYARDLIVEKVEGEAPSAGVAGPKFEYAAYVASPRKEDPRVVAEVTLTHK
jgi:hypothetical protein